MYILFIIASLSTNFHSAIANLILAVVGSYDYQAIEALFVNNVPRQRLALRLAALCVYFLHLTHPRLYQQAGSYIFT